MISQYFTENYGQNKPKNSNLKTMKKFIFFLFAVTIASCSSDENEKYISYTKVSTVTTGLFNPQFEYPTGLTIDQGGNIYVAGYQSSLIKKIDKNGAITNFAGSGKNEDTDGLGKDASFTVINALASDSKGNLYVAGADNNTLRKVTSEGLVSTISEIPHGVLGVYVDKKDNLYVSNGGSIIKFPPTGEASVLAGNINEWAASLDGTGANARFWAVSLMSMDSKGNLFAKENTNSEALRKITPEGVVTSFKVTVKSNGTSIPFSNLDDIQGICFDKNDNMYLSTVDNNILQVTPEGQGRFLFGTKERPLGYKDGSINEALTHGIGHITFDKDENLIIIENAKNGINVRKLSK